MPNALKALYDEASKKYDLGTFNEFVSLMHLPQKREILYNELGEKYDIGDTFQEFEQYVDPYLPKVDQEGNFIHLPEAEEANFQLWYNKWAEHTEGIPEDPDNPAAKYDFRRAWRNKEEPQLTENGNYMWPGKYMHRDHPNRFEYREGQWYDKVNQMPVERDFIAEESKNRKATYSVNIPEGQEYAFASASSKKGKEYVNDLYESLGAGFASHINAPLARIPATIYEIAMLPQNIVAWAADMPELEAKAPEWLKNNPIAKHYDRQAEQLRGRVEHHTQSVWDSIKKGQYGDAFMEMGLQVAENVPIQISMLAAGYGGLPTYYALGGMSALSAAQKSSDMDKDPDLAKLPEFQKTLNMLTHGLAEGTFETLGTVQMGRLGRTLIEKVGKQKAEKLLQSGFANSFKSTLEKFYPLTATQVEGIEELSTQIAQNVNDIASGKDVGVFDGVIDAYILGSVQSATSTVPMYTIGKIKASKEAEQEKQKLYDQMIKDGRLPEDITYKQFKAELDKILKKSPAEDTAAPAPPQPAEKPMEGPKAGQEIVEKPETAASKGRERGEKIRKATLQMQGKEVPQTPETGKSELSPENEALKKRAEEKRKKDREAGVKKMPEQTFKEFVESKGVEWQKDMRKHPEYEKLLEEYHGEPAVEKGQERAWVGQSIYEKRGKKWFQIEKDQKEVSPALEITDERSISNLEAAKKPAVEVETRKDIDAKAEEVKKQAGQRKVDIAKTTNNIEFVPEDIVTQTNQALQEAEDVLDDLRKAGFDPDKARPTQEPWMSLSQAYSRVTGRLQRLANKSKAVEKGYKRGNPEHVKEETQKLKERIQELKRVVKEAKNIKEKPKKVVEVKKRKKPKREPQTFRQLVTDLGGIKSSHLYPHGISNKEDSGLFMQISGGEAGKALDDLAVTIAQLGFLPEGSDGGVLIEKIRNNEKLVTADVQKTADELELEYWYETARNSGAIPEDMTKKEFEIIQAEMIKNAKPVKSDEEENYLFDRRKGYQCIGQTSLNFDNPETYKSPSLGEVKHEATLKALPDLKEGEVANVEAGYIEWNLLNFTGRSPKIETTADIAYLFRALETSNIEHAFIVHINADGNHFIQHIGSGVIGRSFVDPLQIANGVQSFGTKRMYLVHNHPGGDISATKEDQQLWLHLKDTHPDVIMEKGVIIDTYEMVYGLFDDTSFVTSGIGRPEDLDTNIKLPVYTLGKKALIHPQSGSLTSPEKIAAYLSGQRLGVYGKTEVLCFDARMKITGRFHLKEQANTALMMREIAQYASGTGANYVVMVTSDSNADGTAKFMAKAQYFKNELGKRFSVNLLDIIGVEQNPELKIKAYTSVKEMGILSDYKTEYEQEFIEQQAKRGVDIKKIQTMHTKLENRVKLQQKLDEELERGQDDIFRQAERSKQRNIPDQIPELQSTNEAWEWGVTLTEPQIKMVKDEIRALAEQYKQLGPITDKAIKVAYRKQLLLEALGAKARKHVNYSDGQFKYGPESQMAKDAIDAMDPRKKKSGQTSLFEPEAPYTFENQDIEEEHQAAHGVQKPTIKEWIKEHYQKLRNELTRGKFEYLPRTKRWAKIRNELMKLAHQKDVAHQKAIESIEDIVSKMTPEQFNRFERFVLLSDLMEEVEYEHTLPGSWTPEEVEKEYGRLSALVAADPAIQEAMDRRRTAWDGIKDDFIQAMNDIGMNVENRFDRENYFRHQVLEYANAKGLTGTGKRLKTPKGRGYLKRRHGSHLLINTDYLQAEYEVMSQMLYDIKRAEVIAKIDKLENIQKRLKAEAKSVNEDNVMPYFEEIADQLTGALSETSERDPYTAEEAFRIVLNTKIAIGFNKLNKLAMKGMVPAYVGGVDYSHVIEDMQIAAEQQAAAKADFPDDPEMWSGYGIRDEYMGDFWRLLGKLMNEENVPSDVKMAAATIFKGIREKNEFIKNALGDNFKTWEDMIPEGFTTWQPEEGNVLFMSYTIPEKAARMLLEEGLSEIGINQSQVRKMLTVGGLKKQWVIPEELAEQLNDLIVVREKKSIERGLAKTLTAWKIWTLISPRRYFKYNFRNISGDADALFIGNPKAFKKVPQAVNELYDVFTGKKRMSGDLRKWFERGGMSTLLQAQEMGDINKLANFKKLSRDMAGKKDFNIWKKYWRFARLSTDMREAILRYAAFLEYMDQFKANKGQPSNYGASLPDEVDAIETYEDKAFKMANELLGAYDDVSVVGQQLRAMFFPFWSWKEVNFKRYIRFAKNAAHDPAMAERIGVKFVKSAPILAMRVGSFVIKATALISMLQAWNRLFFSDEEDELPQSIKKTPHIIFGRDSNGNILYFNRLGALGDFLEWFGLQEAPYLVDDFLNGKMSMKQVIQQMIESPVNVMVQGVRPDIKMPFELISGQSFFPDIFKPRTIKNKGLHVARSLGLGDEFVAITRLPSKGYTRSLRNFFIYEMDPDQGAFIDIYDAKARYLKNVLGKASGPFPLRDAKSYALYNMKLSIKYKDKKSAERYFMEYINLGGTGKGMAQSLRSMHPSYGIPKRNWDDFFNNFLTKEEKGKYYRAERFFNEVLRASMDELLGD